MPLPFKRAEPWLRSLIGKVDLLKISTPIKVLEEEEIEVEHAIGGRKRKIPVRQFDFQFNFRGTRGNDLKGNGRLFVPARRPKEHLPMIVSMHYEMDANGSARFLAKGCATMTPHGKRNYNFVNLMGDGISHNMALAQIPRRMPFVDQEHVMLFGGSAGGYHALMASSKVFPLTAVYAGVPPLNLKYNIGILMKNDPHNVNPENPDKPPVPVMKVVMPLGIESSKGGMLDAQDWSHFSPTFQTKLMTFPTLITYSTGDILVPVDQLSKNLVQKPPSGLWPDGYTFDMNRIVDNEPERVTFLEMLESDDYSLRSVKIPRDSPTIQKTRDELTPEETRKIVSHKIRWSRTKRFSIFVLDEGYPEPFCGHLKYHHGIADNDFYNYHMSQTSLRTDILTPEKLMQMMQRFSGKMPDLGREYDEEGSWTISRLDHDHIERWYVARGLEIYMESSRRNARHLVRLYKKLPPELRALDSRDVVAEFEQNPLAVLLHHEMVSMARCGDTELASLLARQVSSTIHRKPKTS